MSGIFPSITTPFTNGQVDYTRLKSNVERYNGFDLGGYMILGGNGEYLGLTPDETVNVARTIVSVSKKGRTVVAGAGRESAHATIEFIKIITDIGVDIASIITPYYFAKYMSDEKLIAYYSKIADESPIPILIYNSPSYAAGIEVTPNVVLKLCSHENIVGMKNSSNSEVRDYISVVDQTSDFYLIGGKVGSLVKDFEQGAIGATLSAADYWPQYCINIFELLKQNRKDEALQLCITIDKASKMGASAYGVAGVKYAMDLAGFYGGEPRLPLLPLDEKQKNQVRESFAVCEEQAAF